MTVQNEPGDFEFDIAVSFAGAQRPYVEQVVRQLDLPDGRAFYDSDFQAELWGEDLPTFLTDVYMNKSRYAVMFVSKEYAERVWTNVERRAVIARAIKQRAPYILPIRMDTTELEEVGGMLSTTGYLDARYVGIDGIVDNIRTKLSKTKKSTPRKAAITQVANTPEELHSILTHRPPAWEFLTYVSEIKLRRDALAVELRDHELRYGAPTGRNIRDEAELRHYCVQTMDELHSCQARTENVLQPEAFEAAVGAPGQPGDPDRILHIADRFMDGYQRFLQIAAEVRGTTITPQWSHITEALAQLADKPLEGLNSFIDQLIEQVNSIPSKLAAGEEIVLQPLAANIHMDNARGQQLVDIVKAQFSD